MSIPPASGATTTDHRDDHRAGVDVSFPRLSARTMRFTLGVPAQLTVSPDGDQVLFVRTRSGTDREGLLWRLDVASGEEALVADPGDLLGGDCEALPAAERARRERQRQGHAGITAYSTDRTHETVAVALSGRVFVVGVQAGSPVQVPDVATAVDPRLSPDGTHVAYHADGGLHVAPSDGSRPGRPLVRPDGAAVTWGLSDFVHAEEMGRHRSFWWAPDSSGLLVARVDESPVQQWFIADPAHPGRQSVPVRYPAAGTANPRTSLWHVGLDGTTTRVDLDGPHESCGPDGPDGDGHGAEYLVGVSWTHDRPALVSVLDRTQRRLRVLSWQPGERVSLLREVSDECWVDVVAGVPAWWGERLLTVERDRRADAAVLRADGADVTPPRLQVRSVLGVSDDAVLVAVAEDERETRLGRLHPGGRWEFASSGAAVATGAMAGGTTVVREDGLDSPAPSVTATRGQVRRPLAVHAVRPPLRPRPRLLRRRRADDPRVAVLLPTDASPTRLPVLLDPYGGPHGQRVLAAGRAYLESQWWADQGYAVVVADGPGTPGSPAWQRAMAGAFAEPALAAQVRALEMVGQDCAEEVDLGRVAIRGWSFGGYLAALTVLERPDLVHAGIAGAPVTDWALYDTGYTERYLGRPADHPGRYEAESLLGRAPRLERPLLLIHGLADDNVVAAHTLRLSSALLTAGRSHRVLPLSGVTHMTPQEVVAENLLLAQRDFLTEALGPRS